MKIYLYNRENGYYLGEDFADEASRLRRGRALPDDATAIAPPRVARGEIAVFVAAAGVWEVRPRLHLGVPSPDAGREAERRIS